jgi:hypothetical protein
MVFVTCGRSSTAHCVQLEQVQISKKHRLRYMPLLQHWPQPPAVGHQHMHAALYLNCCMSLLAGAATAQGDRAAAPASTDMAAAGAAGDQQQGRLPVAAAADGCTGRCTAGSSSSSSSSSSW